MISGDIKVKMRHYIMETTKTKRYHVALLELVSNEAYDLIDQNCHLHIDPISPQDLKLIRAIITRGKGNVNKALIHSCPNLQVIARCGVGVNNIDVNEASGKGVLVINTPGVNAQTVAEHTMCLMLALKRNLFSLVEHVRGNNWSFRNNYNGDEINGKKLGIIGLGAIGSRVAHIAQTFGMRIAYWSRTPKEINYPFESLESILSTCDIISLHLPITEETRHIIGAKELARMKPTALLINTGRGDLIDQRALEAALENQILAGFAADVLAQQPPDPSSILLTHPNVLITPHAASLTKTTYNDMCVLSVQNVLRILDGGEIDSKYIYNKELL